MAKDVFHAKLGRFLDRVQLFGPSDDEWLGYISDHFMNEGKSEQSEYAS